jgi:hypothetical protein
LDATVAPVSSTRVNFGSPVKVPGLQVVTLNVASQRKKAPQVLKTFASVVASKEK